jgi:chemotaxis protein histidine kinase CheA
MALSQGLNSVLEARDSFKNLGTLIKGNVTKAFGTLKGAIASTGIGLLVVGLGLLIANFDKVKKVVLNLIPGLGAVADFIGGLVNKITDFVGVTSEAGRATEKLIKDNEKAIKDTERFLDLNADKYDQYTQKKIKANLDFKKKQNEFLADETLSEAQKNKFIAEARDKANREIAASDKERTDKSNEERQKENDKIKADNDKKGQLAKQNLDKQKAFDKELRDAKNKTYLDGIKDEDFRAKEELRIKFENQQLDLQQSDKTAAQKTALKLEYEKQYGLELAKLEQEQADKTQQKAQEDINKAAENSNKKRQKAFEDKQKQLTDEAALDLQNANNQDLSFEQRLQAVQDRENSINSIVFESEAAKTEFEKQNADARIKIAQDEAAQKVATTKAIGDAMGQLSEIIGKETAVGKGLAVAQATINTWLGATEVLRAKSTLPEPIGTISKIVNVAAIVASGIKSVKSILATRLPGGGGGGGTSPSLPSVNAPLTPQIQTTNLNQGQINQLASATSRAFVLESDVSGSQERIQRLNRAARIN